MKLLVTGDLHLGRRATRLPGAWADDRRFSALAAWEAIVETAITEEVAAVVLTGDVIDRENRFYEALGPFEEGIRRLAAAGIDSVAIAGNHDFDVLPRLAGPLAEHRFHLLGRGGRWERLRLERGGEPWVALDGWSFPREHVESDPLDDYDLPREPELPVLGLLHSELLGAARGEWLGALRGELGGPRSRYAATSAARLRSLPPAAWLLGHTHTPGLQPGGVVPVLYPGSPQPLDLREPGAHGPWLIEIAGGRVLTPVLRPRAAVRYEEVTIDLEGLTSRAEIDTRLVPGLRSALERAAGESGDALALLVARLRFTGRTALAGGLDAALAPLAELSLRHGRATAAVIGWSDATRPEIDLAALAGSDAPTGALARTLLALEAGGADELVREAEARLAAVHGGSAYGALGGAGDGDRASARQALRDSAWKLLEQLLAQKDPAGEAA